MRKIVFELTIESRDAGILSDAEEIENIRSVVLDGLGFPDGVTVTVKVIKREPESKSTG